MKGAAEKRAMVAGLINKLNMATIRINLDTFFGQEACPEQKLKVITKLLDRCEWLTNHIDELTIDDLKYSKSGMQEVSDWEYLGIKF